MTRSFRAIRFPQANLTLLSAIAAATLFLAPAQAFADPDAVPTLQNSDPVADAAANDDKTMDGSKDDKLSADDMTAQAAPVAEVDNAIPSIEKPLHHLYCVEYARVRSGFQIFGDAKTWWQKARNFYSEITTPAADTVMVFSGSRRITRGHVAVVTKILGPREIRVDQANWQNHGEIDHNTPVLDVSPNNDWSKVRVWDIRSGQFGGHIYAISGFIARSFPIPQGS
jgi:hypothetical protein